MIILLARLSAYGFDYNSLELINSFLSGRKFRTKIVSSYSPNHKFPKIQIHVITYPNYKTYGNDAFILYLIKQKNMFRMIKKLAKFLTISFQTLLQA